jgi:large subunit ribosomal protein L9
MEVVLKETVQRLGKVGDVISVTDGYARNFLLPQNKAVKVTPKTLKAIQESFKKKAAKASEEEITIKDVAGKMDGTGITIKKLASEDDKLFGSVAETDIADELKKLGFEVDKSNVILAKHIKELGVFDVAIRLKYDAEAKIKVFVVRDDSEQKG